MESVIRSPMVGQEDIIKVSEPNLTLFLLEWSPTPLLDGARSHVVHQMLTQMGAKSSNNILEGSSLIICSTRSLSMNFVNYGSHDQNYYLIIH